MFCCKMVDLRNVLIMCPEKGRFDPNTSLCSEKDILITVLCSDVSKKV